MTDLSTLDDQSLLQLADRLVETERHAGADFIHALADIHRRAIWNDFATSLWMYCRKRWGFSEASAGRRARAAEVAKDHLCLIRWLRDGELNLETIGLLYPLRQRVDFVVLLEKARGRSMREIEALVAMSAPRPDTAEIIRAAPAARVIMLPDLPGGGLSIEQSTGSAPIAPEHAAVIAVPRERPARMVQLAPERVQISFTGPLALRQKVERLRDLLRHKYPEGKLEQLIEDAVDHRLEALDPALQRPSRGPRRMPPPSRQIPRWVKQAVWKRDAGLCSWVAEDGSRCKTTQWLEYDHVLPVSLGGQSVPDNLRLLCRTHNQWRGKRLRPL